MKTPIERRLPAGFKDRLSIAVTTFGVGYIPLAPGTWGSAVGVAIYFGFEWILYSFGMVDERVVPYVASSAGNAVIAVALLLFTLLGIWAAGRSTELFGDLDPSHAVVDEIIGQLITFLFIPFGLGWQYILAGFLLFRLFDIWKPYPIDYLQKLPAGIGVCADDILAGVYAGVCLSVIYAISLAV